MDTSRMNPFRNIPSVNELLESPPLQKLVDRVSHNAVVDGVRTFLEDLRQEVQTAKQERQIPSTSDLAEQIARWIVREEEAPLRPVVNATGILLHTNLGRAPLAEEAIAEIAAVARGYCSLETDLATGQRSKRQQAVERLLCRHTGAEAATVVNNNAAATLIVLASVAAGREVVVSRGQLIEIGGSYRLPDVMEASGATLREVGTTNKTRIADYQHAIRPETAALMQVHTSNYVVVGFQESTPLEEMVELARRRKILVIDDIGSGALADYTKYAIGHEPLPRESIRAGADLVLFSGDKLLGGPQCGIICGRRPLIEKIMKHPLMRAMRVGKLTLAALHATLKLYDRPEELEQRLPLLRLLSTSCENLRNRAERLAPQLQACEVVEQVEVVDADAYLGGGSIPSQCVASVCLAIQPAGVSEDLFAARLRNGTPAVMGRVQEGRVLLDLRTVFPGQDSHLVEAVAAIKR